MEKQNQIILALSAVAVAAVLVVSGFLITSADPAEFRISSMDLSSNEVQVGENVTVSAVVTNVGDREGNYNATLFVDNESIKNRKVSVGPEESEEINFKITREEEGNYEVRIGDISKTLTVNLNPAELLLERSDVPMDYEKSYEKELATSEEAAEEYSQDPVTSKWEELGFEYGYGEVWRKSTQTAVSNYILVFSDSEGAQGLVDIKRQLIYDYDYYIERSVDWSVGEDSIVMSIDSQNYPRNVFLWFRKGKFVVNLAVLSDESFYETIKSDLKGYASLIDDRLDRM